MKVTGIIACIAGLCLGGFGAWGMLSDAGRRQYDEMDGLYPIFALLAAVVAIATGIVVLVFSGRHRDPRRRGFPVMESPGSSLPPRTRQR